MRLRKINKMQAISLAKFKLNEYTTEFGTIIFDNSKDGKISNSFLYRIGYENYGHIDIYIDKKLKIINSIWLVNLGSKILFSSPNLKNYESSYYSVPFFDTTIWKDNGDQIWPRIDCEEHIEVYHNGVNVVQITFGKINYTESISNNISFQYDENDILTGIHLRNENDVSVLIDLLKMRTCD